MNTLFHFILFAIMNRGRGSALSIPNLSTTIGRLVSMGCIAIVIADSWTHFLTYWGLLYFWTLPAWDVYWGAAGQSAGTVVKPAFAPADWFLRLLKISPGTRLWGVVGMGVRQGLCMLPLFIAIAYFTSNYSTLIFSLVPFLFGIPYWLWSVWPYAKNTGNFILYSELTVGAFMGLIL